MKGREGETRRAKGGRKKQVREKKVLSRDIDCKRAMERKGGEAV